MFCLQRQTWRHCGMQCVRRRTRWPNGTRFKNFPSHARFLSLCAAAEVATLRDAVTVVREAADAIAGAEDIAQQPMLCLNLREARDILARRLEQLSPQCSSGVGMAAASEATILLVELDALL
jgi:hypothetical protein